MANAEQMFKGGKKKKEKEEKRKEHMNVRFLQGKN